ncbi:unnamed protein product, partial [Allacma fusca]
IQGTKCERRSQQGSSSSASSSCELMRFVFLRTAKNMRTMMAATVWNNISGRVMTIVKSFPKSK